MIRVKCTRHFLEYFMTEGEELRACKVKTGIPVGCKIIYVHFDGEIITLYFSERKDEGLIVSSEVLLKSDIPIIEMNFEAISGHRGGGGPNGGGLNGT